MTDHSDWSDRDNKHYTGKIDRMYVSMTESHELRCFIDHYLETRGFDLTHDNRDIIARALEKYPGRVPFKRTALIEYLDRKFLK